MRPRALYKIIQYSSLKTKLVLMISAVTVMSLLFSGAFIFSYEVARAKKIIAQDMLTLSEITASTSTAALVFSDRKAINEYLSSLSRRTDVMAACIYNSNREVLGKYRRTGSREDCPASPGPDGEKFGSDSVLRLFGSIRFENERIGTIFIASDLAKLRGELRFQATLVGAVLFAAITLALLFSGWIQRYVSGPVLSLAQTVKKISKDRDYSVRVTTVRHDEIGILIEEFNRMLAQIETQNAYLRESTQILQSVLNSMGDGVVVVDLAGKVMVWNAAAEQLLGPAPNLARSGWAEYFELYQADAQVPCSTEQLPLSRAMRGELLDQEEYYLRRSKEGELCLSVTARPLVGPSGKISGGVSVFRDVSERRRMEAEKERLLREAQEAVKLRDEFMSIASHELKTPLAPLRTQVQMLQRLSRSGALQKSPPERIEKLMTFTDNQVKKLVGLIEDLLDVTRITSGKLELQLEDVDFASLVREVLSQHRQEIQRSHSKVQTHFEEKIVASWDRFRIEQVLVNLLTNALKYGQGKDIRIEAHGFPDWVEFSVQDQGIGISPDAQDRIFGRFERAVSMSHYGGLGLGLYISKQIVAAHGGTIRVESEMGKGSKFIVVLPWKVKSSGAA